MGFVRYPTLPWMVCRDLNKGRFARLLVPSDKAMSTRWMLVPDCTSGLEEMKSRETTGHVFPRALQRVTRLGLKRR